MAHAIETAKKTETRLGMTVMIATGIALLVIGALALQGGISGIPLLHAELLVGIGSVLLTPLAVMVVMSVVCCPALTVRVFCPEERRGAR